MAIVPASIESLPSSALTVRSSITLSFTGSLPDARLTASWLALSTVKLPLICARPPRIGSLMFGRRKHLVVEDDRERLADILLSDPAEAAGAGGIEGDVDNRPAVLVEALLGVDELLAGNHDAALDSNPTVAIGHGQYLAARRRTTGGDLGRIGIEVDQLEFQPGGLADQLLQRLGVLDARDLDENPPLALVDDGDFLGAARIDSAADNIARDRQ